MKKVFGLKGRIQHYAWGGREFIPRLLGMRPKGDPCAEYWLGAHSSAPALVVTKNGEVPLDNYLDTDPKVFLGDDVFNKFGRLPFLFKVLDVEKMLSIQVHPSKKEAEKGFNKENELGIPLTAANRNYKDDNHKPEIMVALSEFWLLHGFLSRKALMRVLENNIEFSSLLPVFLKDGYQGLYQYVMELNSAESDKLLSPLIKRILPLYKEKKLLKSSADFWAAKAVSESEGNGPLEKGIFSIYFFNILRLEKGQAIFQDAGIPHAYLEGQNMELMANSDNVLRGGLTQKHIDVVELLKHITFEETEPRILTGSFENHQIEKKFKTSAPDFELSEVSINHENSYTSKSHSAEIYILLEGKAQIREAGNSIDFKKGDSFLVLADAKYEISTPNYAVLYKAKTP